MCEYSVGPDQWHQGYVPWLLYWARRPDVEQDPDLVWPCVRSFEVKTCIEVILEPATGIIVDLVREVYRTHPCNIISLEAKTRRCWTFVPTPTPTYGAQVHICLFQRWETIPECSFTLCVSNIIFFFCRLKINHMVVLQVRAFLLELGVVTNEKTMGRTSEKRGCK